jgi:hypothetical protein
MKRFWPACVALLAMSFAVVGCNDYGNTFQNPTGALITTLSPNTAAAGGPDLTLTVQGRGFVAKTVVQWNEKTIQSTPVMDSAGDVLYMTAVVPAALIAKQGSAGVNTLNPHSGSTDNGLSNTITFLINPPPNPVPVVTSISPNIISPGAGADLTLMVNGSNFLTSSDPSGGSKVRWNQGATQTELTLTSGTATLLQATVPAALLQTESCAIVSVYNPPSANGSSGGITPPPGSGGGTSANAPTFTISTDPNFCLPPTSQLRFLQPSLFARSRDWSLSSALAFFPTPRSRHSSR